MSCGQERLWYLRHFESDGGAAYNLGYYFQFPDAPDVALLKQAINEIVARHEILRTALIENDGTLNQVIEPKLTVALPVVDLSESGSETSVAQYSQQALSRPFDFATAPLLRTELLSAGADKHILLVIVHHALFDGWSATVLEGELNSIYRALLNQEPIPGAPLQHQYRDYARWQQTWMRGPECEQQLEFWKTNLAGAGNLNLPTDFPRPAAMSYAGANENSVLPAAMISELNQLARTEQATLFMALAAALKVLLYRHTFQDDLVVGVPFANRSQPEYRDSIGFFVNTLVLRTSLKGRPSYRELLAEVRDVCTQAYAHSDLPFERLVEAINPPRDQGATPIFQVFAGFQGASMAPTPDGSEQPRWKCEPLHADSALTDLSIWWRELESGLETRLNYNTRLFAQGTIRLWLQRFEQLIRSIVANPDAALADLTIAPAWESQLLLDQRTASDTNFPEHLCAQDLVSGNAQKTPQAVAAVYGKEKLSYGELEARSSQLARRLRQLGAAPGVRIAIHLPRTLDMLVAVLAALKSGAAYVPIDPEYPDARKCLMMTDAQPAIVISESSLDSAAIGFGGDTVLMDTDSARLEQLDGAPFESTVSPRDLAYLIYTSGSTGVPKAVQVTHRSLANFLASMARTPGIGQEDVLYAVTTLSFDISILELLLPLCVGARLVIAPAEHVRDGAAMLRDLRDNNVTVMQATPSGWRLLLGAGWSGDPPLKVLCGGEAMPGEIAQELVGCSNSVWNMYGPTETTIWSSCYELKDPSQARLIGRPIANTQIHILDEDLQPAPLGVPGEIYIGGAGVSPGYWGQPDLTRERFIPDPFTETHPGSIYRTGDVGRFTLDGDIEYLHRVDRQVKVRGFRIELGDLESALTAHGQVREAVATVLDQGSGDQRLTAYFVGEASNVELRKHLGSALPQYMLPQHLVSLEAIPRLANGKINFAALPSPESASKHDHEGSDDATLATPTEQHIGGIWAEVLGIEVHRSDSNFFELGGHSLLSVGVISRIEKELGVRITLVDMLVCSLEQIAATVDRTNQATEPVLKASVSSWRKRVARWLRR